MTSSTATRKKALAAEIAAHPHGRVPRALRREQLLAAAYDLFVERGYRGASMDELARRVGVSKPVIYDLAGSKDRLFREVMAGIQAELSASIATAVADERDLPSMLHAGILGFLRFVRRRREGWSALLSMEAGGGAEVATLRREQVALVAALLAEGARRGGGAFDARTAEILAHAVNGAVEFVAAYAQSHPSRSPEALASLLSSLLSPGLLGFADAARAGESNRSGRRGRA